MHKWLLLEGGGSGHESRKAARRRAAESVLRRNEMNYSNNFSGKKRMVRDLADIYRRINWSDIADIELKKYRKDKTLS